MIFCLYIKLDAHESTTYGANGDWSRSDGHNLDAHHDGGTIWLTYFMSCILDKRISFREKHFRIGDQETRILNEH